MVLSSLRWVQTEQSMFLMARLGVKRKTHNQTGEYLRTLPTEQGHKKGLYGVGWDTDSKHIYTASADCSIKVLHGLFIHLQYWDVTTGECEATLPIGDGKSLDYNQLGCMN